jgi:hypothetical protein
MQNVVSARYANRRLMIAALATLPVEKHLEQATRFKRGRSVPRPKK